MEIVPESKLWPVALPHLISEAPKMPMKPLISGGWQPILNTVLHWKTQRRVLTSVDETARPNSQRIRSMRHPNKIVFTTSWLCHCRLWTQIWSRAHISHGFWDIFRLEINGFRGRKSSKNLKMNGHRGFVGELLFNRFGHPAMLALSTRRDLFISAIISNIFLVERVVKVPNVERNIAFFGSRSAEQATLEIFLGTGSAIPPS